MVASTLPLIHLPISAWKVHTEVRSISHATVLTVMGPTTLIRRARLVVASYYTWKAKSNEWTCQTKFNSAIPMFSIADADPQVACCILLCAIVLPLILSFTSCMLHIARVGQNRIYAPYMTVYLVISPPKIPYIHRIYIYAFGQPYILLCAKKYFPSFFHSRVACCILLCAKGTSPHSFIHKLHVAYCCVQTSTSPHSFIHELHIAVCKEVLPLILSFTSCMLHIAVCKKSLPLSFTSCMFLLPYFWAMQNFFTPYVQDQRCWCPKTRPGMASSSDGGLN